MIFINVVDTIQVDNSLNMIKFADHDRQKHGEQAQ